MVLLEIQNYDENKKIYTQVENKLRNKLELNIPISHVGSTAIPSMKYGKNIIDILIGVQNIQQFESVKNIIINEGYIPSTKSRDEEYQFFSSIEGETGSGDIHIHLAIINTERYQDFITLRDYLLSHEEEVINYSNFKKELIDKGITDRKEYKTFKSEYVTQLLKRAKNSMKE